MKRLKPAIDDLKQMPVVRYEKLIKMKEKPSAVVYFCNECGKPERIGIYCCSVDGDPDKGLGNFTECVVWFTKGVIKRVIRKKEPTP